MNKYKNKKDHMERKVPKYNMNKVIDKSSGKI